MRCTSGLVACRDAAPDGVENRVRFETIAALYKGRTTGELSAAVDALRSLMGVQGEARGAAALASSAGMDRPAQVMQAAHALHEAIMAPVGDMIAGRELVIVPSRRLAGLPFHMLVGEKPDPQAADPYGSARWLALDHAITVLPSVQALHARSLVRPANDRPDIYRGFANPILAGRAGDDSRARSRLAQADAIASGSISTIHPAK